MTLREIDYSNLTEVARRCLHILFNASAAVVIFYVLSGHVLFSTLSRNSASPLVELPAYALRRLSRLYPVIVVSFMLYALVFPRSSLREVIDNMLLLSISMNSVTWSLQVELVGSGAVFVAWWISRGAPWLLWVLAVGFAAWAFGYPHYVVHSMPAFFLGCAVGQFRARFGHASATFVLAVLCLLCATFVVGTGIGGIMIESLMAFLVIVNIPSGAGQTLGSAVTLFLGRISFPFYLVHGVCAYVATVLLGRFGLSWIRSRLSLPCSSTP